MKVFDVGHTSTGNEVAVENLEEVLHGCEIRTGEHSICGNICIDNGADTDTLSRKSEFTGGLFGGFGPTFDRDETIFGIDADRDALSPKFRAHLTDIIDGLARLG